jgi:hypothetical protein
MKTLTLHLIGLVAFSLPGHGRDQTNQAANTQQTNRLVTPFTSTDGAAKLKVQIHGTKTAKLHTSHAIFGRMDIAAKSGNMLLLADVSVASQSTNTTQFSSRSFVLLDTNGRRVSTDFVGTKDNIPPSDGDSRIMHTSGGWSMDGVLSMRRSVIDWTIQPGATYRDTLIFSIPDGVQVTNMFLALQSEFRFVDRVASGGVGTTDRSKEIVTPQGETTGYFSNEKLKFAEESSFMQFGSQRLRIAHSGDALKLVDPITFTLPSYDDPLNYVRNSKAVVPPSASVVWIEPTKDGSKLVLSTDTNRITSEALAALGIVRAQLPAFTLEFHIEPTGVIFLLGDGTRYWGATEGIVKIGGKAMRNVKGVRIVNGVPIESGSTMTSLGGSKTQVEDAPPPKTTAPTQRGIDSPRFPVMKLNRNTSVANTTWIGKDSDGELFEYRFEQNGSFRHEFRRGSAREGSWTQNGATVSFETISNFYNYHGTIEGNVMEGETQSDVAETYCEWSATNSARPFVFDTNTSIVEDFHFVRFITNETAFSRIYSIGSTLRLVNQSSEPALVRLTGPTSEAEPERRYIVVPQYGEKKSRVRDGDYNVKIRFGSRPHFTYSKGDSVSVTDTSEETTAVTITFNAISGNYSTIPITKEEFWR